MGVSMTEQRKYAFTENGEPKLLDPFYDHYDPAKDGEQTSVQSQPTTPKRQRLIEADSATRKQYPMATGLLDYFPDALAEVAKLSYLGNLKHNPGQPLHHSRGKSTDHPDCIMRHLVERGGFEDVTIDGVVYQQRHSASLVWRALALLQEELEHEHSLPLPRGAHFD